MNTVASRVAKYTAAEFRQLLGKNRRGFIAFDHVSNLYKTSHNELSEIVDCFNNNDGNPLHRDFHNHEGLYFECGKDTGTIFGVFLHSTIRGAGQGGVRFWTYNTLTDYVCEGMRLSRSMGLKNALAGLYWGGGKGVIWRETSDSANAAYKDNQFRKTMFEEYGYVKIFHNYFIFLFLPSAF